MRENHKPIEFNPSWNLTPLGWFLLFFAYFTPAWSQQQQAEFQAEQAYSEDTAFSNFELFHLANLPPEARRELTNWHRVHEQNGIYEPTPKEQAANTHTPSRRMGGRGYGLSW